MNVNRYVNVAYVKSGKFLTWKGKSLSLNEGVEPACPRLPGLLAKP